MPVRDGTQQTPLSGGVGLAPRLAHLYNYPLGDFCDAMAVVYATLSHCQLGC